MPLLLILALLPCSGLLAATDTYPEAKKKAPPIYTKAILAKHLSGVVVVSFVAEEDGSVSEVKIKKSPAPELSESAIECVKKWKFLPAMKDGKPVRMHMELPIVFDPK